MRRRTWIAGWLIAVVTSCGPRGGAAPAPVSPTGPGAVTDGAAGAAAGATGDAAGRSPAGATEPARLVKTIDGARGTTIHVYLGRIYDGTPVVTLVTEGLTAFDHPELLLSVTARSKDELGQVLPGALSLVQGLTASVPAQVRLDPWMSASLGSGVLGRDDLVGLAAVPAEAAPGVVVPARAVALLVLTRAETEAARRFGAARVAAMIGQRYRYYPTAWWLDVDRPTVVGDADLDTTVLAGREWPRLAGLHYVYELAAAPTPTSTTAGLPEGSAPMRGRVHLRLTAAAATALGDGLRGAPASTAAFALVAPDDSAGARAVWKPGADRLEVITGPGLADTITGNFVGVIVDDGRHGARLFEDGLVIAVSPAERDRLVGALGRGGRFAPDPPTDELAPWQLEWLPPPAP